MVRHPHSAFALGFLQMGQKTQDWHKIMHIILVCKMCTPKIEKKNKRAQQLSEYENKKLRRYSSTTVRAQEEKLLVEFPVWRWCLSKVYSSYNLAADRCFSCHSYGCHSYGCHSYSCHSYGCHSCGVGHICDCIGPIVEPWMFVLHASFQFHFILYFVHSMFIVLLNANKMSFFRWSR